MDDQDDYGPHDPRHVLFFEFLQMDMVWAENATDFYAAHRRGIQHADKLNEEQRKWLAKAGSKHWKKSNHRKDAQLQKEILWCLPYIVFIKPNGERYSTDDAIEAVMADNERHGRYQGDDAVRRWIKRVRRALRMRLNSVSR